MRIYTNDDLGENAVTTLLNLVSVLNVPVTKSAINNVKSHNEYPSLNSLSDLLREWNIENMGVEITSNQLFEIPLPAICHLNTLGGMFIVLHECKSDGVKYIDSKTGWISEPVSEFEKKWSKAVLLVQTNEKSGEKNFTQKRRLEVTEQAKTIGILALCTLFLIIPIIVAFKSSFYILWVALLVIKSSGLALCIGLLLKQLGLNNSLVNKVCSASRNFDCSNILNSPASKLFGVVSMSELGVIYFAGGLITLVLTGVLKVPFFSSLLILSMITLPYTVFSLFYQWKVVKAWCPLCLAVVFLLWVEFTVLLRVTDFNLHVNDVVFAFIGFGIPLILWMLFRNSFIKAQRIDGVERALAKFKHSSNIFNALLEKQPSVDTEDFPYEIVLGNKSATTSITMVSNPTCGPCSLAHSELEDLLKECSGQLKVRIRFSVNPSQNGSASNTVAKGILRKAVTGDGEGARKALQVWFNREEGNVAKWLVLIGDEKKSEEGTLEDLFKKHYEWCSASGIKATPTFFLNDKKLPEEYNVSDLKYHVKNLINN